MSDVSDAVDGGPTMTPQDASLPPLCTTEDVSGRLMAALSTEQQTAAPLFISDASAMIRRYCGKKFTQAQTVDVLQIRTDAAVQLPESPVQSVDAVSIVNPDGSLTPIVLWYWDQADIIRFQWDGGLLLNAPSIWQDVIPDTVQVTYTHGYDEVPLEVTGVCAAMVIRRLTEPAAHLRTMRVGSYEEMYYDAQSPGSVYLTADDKVALKDFRRSNKTIRLTS